MSLIRKKKMKKITIVMMSLMMAGVLGACSQTEQKPEEPKQEENVEIPNPFTEVTDLSEAEELTGFGLTTVSEFEGYEQSSITVMSNEMIQVNYAKDDEKITVRKAAGSEDISGDYNVYEDEKEVTVGDLTVLLKGNDGVYMNATWQAEGYTYSVTASAGFSEEVMSELVSAIK